MGKHRGKGKWNSDGGGHNESQDRDERFGDQFTHSSRGGGGGGDAGGHRRPGGPDLTFQRSVPKFLQPYAHLMEKGNKTRRPPAHVHEDSDDDDEHAEAVARALEENPELAEEVDPQLLKKARAAAKKEQGNEAFKAKDFETAVKHFTEAIAEDNTDAVFYSNRSAANAALAKWEDALADAKQCVTLKPDWAKGWARLGAAHVGLEEWSEAKEAYFKALELEPDDNSFKRAWEQADYNERQQSQQHKHTFKRRKPAGSSTSQRPAKKAVLSFQDDEDEEADGDG